MHTRKWTRLVAALLCTGLLACSSPKEPGSPPAQVSPPTAPASEAPAVALEVPRDDFRGDFFDSVGLASLENGKICFVSYARRDAALAQKPLRRSVRRSMVSRPTDPSADSGDAWRRPNTTPRISAGRRIR